MVKSFQDVLSLRVFFSFFFLRKNFHDPGHTVKKHRSEIFLDKHIWYKIPHSSVRRDNLDVGSAVGRGADAVPSRCRRAGRLFCSGSVSAQGRGSRGWTILLLHLRPRVLCGQRFWGAVTIPPSLPPANSARASLGPGPAARTRSSDSGSNFLRPACSSFAGLSALRSQGIPGSSGWILFGLTHHHQSCQLIRAEGDDV